MIKKVQGIYKKIFFKMQQIGQKYTYRLKKKRIKLKLIQKLALKT
jgi:hypothetical protein